MRKYPKHNLLIALMVVSVMLITSLGSADSIDLFKRYNSGWYGLFQGFYYTYLYQELGPKTRSVNYYNDAGRIVWSPRYGIRGKGGTRIVYRAENGKSIRVVEYGNNGRLSSEFYYDLVTGFYSMMDSYDHFGKKCKRIEFNDNGKPRKVTYYNTSTGKASYSERYHDNGTVKDRTYYSAHSGQMIKKESFNEKGLKTSKIYFNFKGIQRIKFTYDGNTGKKQDTEYYDDNGERNYRVEYYPSGRISGKYYDKANSKGHLGYEYSDEPYNGHQQGRVIRTFLADGSVEKVISFWEGSDVPRIVELYDANGALIKDMYYSQNGALIKEGYSRAYAPTGYTVYKYANVSGATHEPLLEKTEKDGESVTYYSDTGFIESRTFSAPDENGNIYYHYINEASGRMDKYVAQEADADGAVAYEVEYDGATDRIVSRTSYAYHGGQILTNVNLDMDVSMGNLPCYVEITPDSRFAYVTNYGANTISKIDMATKLKVGEDLDVGRDPGDIKISSDGRYAYYTSCRDDYIGIIDLENDEVLAETIQVGRYPWAMELTGDDRYCYTVDWLAGSVSVVDLQAKQKIKTIEVGSSPYHIRIDPSGEYAYVTNGGSDSVSVIDLSTNTKLAEDIIVGDRPCHSAITPDGAYLYVVNNYSGTVSVIDIASRTKLTNDIPVGDGPEGIEITADGKYAYVTNGVGDSVSVIDLSTNTKLVQDIPVGDLPKDLVISPGDQHAYIVNFLDGDVSLLELFSPTDNVIDPANPEFKYLKATTTYWNDTGMMRSKTLTGSDDNRNIYYHYMNEDWLGSGQGRVDVSARIFADSEGAMGYVYEYYPGSDLVKRKKLYSSIDHSDPEQPVVDGLVKAYEYFYDAAGTLVREKQYLGGDEMGIVREYIEGVLLPVKVIDDQKNAVYRKVFGTSGSPSLTMRYYESDPDGSPWGSFVFGGNGETVFIKDVICGTQVTRRLIYVYDGDLDIETAIDWEAATNMLETGEEITTGTLYEVYLDNFSVYEIIPHFPYGMPDHAGPEYPFTYYDSGRVHTRFECATKAGEFTKAEEATEITYEYADEAFYADKEAGQFLSDLIYYADEPSDLKDFLIGVDPGTLGIRELIAYINANALPENGFTQDDVKGLLISLPLSEPYEAHGRLIKKTFPDGSYTVFEYDGDTDTLLETRTYRIDGALLEKRVAAAGDKEFIGMGNLPWIRYGEGIGVRSVDGWHSGYSRGRSGWENLTGYEELRAGLEKWKDGYVRLFLFADMRAGMMFDANGSFTGFTDFVIQDMETLLNTAKELNIKLIPTLFDYRMADGVESVSDHEHVDLIKDENATAVLLAHFDWFFDEVMKLANYDAIYAWDVINEPEISCEGHLGDITGVTMEEMQVFVRKFVTMIHQKDPEALVTVGSLTKSEMMKYWVSYDNACADGDLSVLDLYQFHYYDSYKYWQGDNTESPDYDKASLNLFGYKNDKMQYFYSPNYLKGKPVIGGEIDPTYVTNKLDTLADHGYDGLLFWDDKGNALDAMDYQALQDWFYGTVYTYYPDTGEIESVRGPDLDDPAYVYFHYDEEGRIDVSILKAGDKYGVKAYTYEYHEGTDIVSVRKGYHTAEYKLDTSIPVLSNPVVTETFDQEGQLLPEETSWEIVYYPESWFMKAYIEDPDTSIKYYLDENWEFRGYGRELMEYYDGIAHVYSVIGDEYQRYGQWEWENIDVTDPHNPVFSGFLRYNGDWNGSSTEYYNPEASDNEKRMKSRTMPKADVCGMVYYHYIDEDIDQAWNTQGAPRADEAHLEATNAKGEIAFKYEYYADSIQPSRVSSYSATSCASNELVAVYEYDMAGKILVSTMYAEANSKGERALEFEYYEGEDDGALHFVYAYSSTDRDPEDLLSIYEYDTEGGIVAIFENGTLDLAGKEDRNAPSGSVSESEILSKYNAILKNRSTFTGYTFKGEEYICGE
ncbi:MAG: beta-propeller fold lactonase family protein [Candidatus Omnitrophica bacterium]|nr:beta-propeller fold lactonase family protein [Candidatus Omnitrophota bacterium]MDD5488285.1 beta-propeller fold lactonase family protein [Candidatus Omnitrophota bacterium]